MAIELPSQLTKADFLKRLAITLAALFAYRFGATMPVPDPSIHWPKPIAWPQYFSLFSLGINSFYTAIVWLGLAKLAYPAIARWEVAKLENEVKLHRYILVAALILSSLQSVPLVLGVERIYRPVTLHTLIAPGSGYIYAAALSLIVGDGFRLVG